ncbi:MAG: adenylosuccinate lyase, partial [Clostridia bacterium]|nr:adenylosuccinate lyase [Clostridia bacterium]
RYVICEVQNTAFTASSQWLERTLDDSANRRLSLPESFLATDAVLELYANIASGMVVYPKMIARHIDENLPFMATENILMEAVRLGGDRQELHEKIRVHSQAAAARVKAEGLNNDLLDRIADDLAFPLDRGSLSGLLDAKLYIGRAPQQVEDFISECVNPLLEGEAAQDIGDIRV